MKIIFLDIDGVLNHRGTLRPDFAHNCSHKAWDPKCVAALKAIIEATNANIVVSSTWRFNLMPRLIEGFEFFNVKLPLSTTPFHGPMRGEEIAEWIRTTKHKDIESYVIIDDDNDMLNHQQEHFVQTTMQVDKDGNGGGLTMEHAKVAISILQDPDRYRRQICMTERDVKAIKLLIESAEKRQEILEKSIAQYKKSKLDGFIAGAEAEHHEVTMAAVTARRFLERECQVTYYKEAKGIPNDALNNPILPKVVSNLGSVTVNEKNVIDFFKELENG